MRGEGEHPCACVSIPVVVSSAHQSLQLHSIVIVFRSGHQPTYQPPFYSHGHSVAHYGFEPQAQVHHHYMQILHFSFPPPNTVQVQHQPMSMQGVDVMHELAPYAQERAQAVSNDSFRRGARQSAALPQCKCKSKQLFIRNLPSSFTEAELRGMFEEFGVVTRSSIVRTRRGNTRYAFVKFLFQTSADKAMGLDEYEVS